MCEQSPHERRDGAPPVVVLADEVRVEVRDHAADEFRVDRVQFVNSLEERVPPLRRNHRRLGRLLLLGGRILLRRFGWAGVQCFVQELVDWKHGVAISKAAQDAPDEVPRPGALAEAPLAPPRACGQFADKRAEDRLRNVVALAQNLRHQPGQLPLQDAVLVRPRGGEANAGERSEQLFLVALALEGEHEGANVSQLFEEAQRVHEPGAARRRETAQLLDEEVQRGAPLPRGQRRLGREDAEALGEAFRCPQANLAVAVLQVRVARDGLHRGLVLAALALRHLPEDLCPTL
mmetsp:Transcript_9656/g.28691  ORF Transcript_9656/g.28691 Transcript_9656/m.28691 type:complete len:291 (-) Transcript_9656:77-949(-)